MDFPLLRAWYLKTKKCNVNNALKQAHTKNIFLNQIHHRTPEFPFNYRIAIRHIHTLGASPCRPHCRKGSCGWLWYAVQRIPRGGRGPGQAEAGKACDKQHKAGHRCDRPGPNGSGGRLRTFSHSEGCSQKNGEQAFLIFNRHGGGGSPGGTSRSRPGCSPTHTPPPLGRRRRHFDHPAQKKFPLSQNA